MPTIKTLSLAFIYDDAQTHHPATRLYELLLQELEDDAELHATWWRMSLLDDPKLAHAAARSIANSDLIIFSVRGDQAPSSKLKNWIESWPLQAGRAGRLFILLQPQDREAMHSNSWDGYLREFAARRSVFYLPGPSSDQLTTLSATEEVESDASRPTDPYLHWGLNE